VSGDFDSDIIFEEKNRKMAVLQLFLCFFLLQFVPLAISWSIPVPISPDNPIRPRPLIVTSKYFLRPHDVRGPHQESPDRIEPLIYQFKRIRKRSKFQLKEPSAMGSSREALKARNVLKMTHTVDCVKRMNGACFLHFSRFPSLGRETFLHNDTYKACLYAQSAWMNCVDHVFYNETMAFALTRPPGHHASRNSSIGNCIFNFAMGAANYAIEKYKSQRVAILDLDANYGNGIADLMKRNRKIRYCSIHQKDLLIPGRGNEDECGVYENIKNIPLQGPIQGEEYLEILRTKALPWIKSFKPDLVIVPLGLNTLQSDSTSDVGCFYRLFSFSFSFSDFVSFNSISSHSNPRIIIKSLLSFSNISPRRSCLV
jgi:acetoin utilization deacetylase AcuC-like enzyme